MSVSSPKRGFFMDGLVNMEKRNLNVVKIQWWWHCPNSVG